ncbi:hypothetical protein ALO_12646 [Acetonema longum DSM 6540]|uniref:Uncharacterized protein n=1 Tax=Acetonema longum DSM 6540 TaxID=1009370 RepID=F7NKB6_9FIRM|nr:hypothetical protein ALO_12646 [Acetonema longum DSM 6540]
MSCKHDGGFAVIRSKETGRLMDAVCEDCNESLLVIIEGQRDRIEALETAIKSIQKSPRINSAVKRICVQALGVSGDE